jgi:predicted RNA polymerase sigma factor
VVTVTAGPEAGSLPAGSGGLRDGEFAQFFRAEHKKLIRFVMAIGAGGDEAAEIAQVAFFKAFEGWDVIRSPRAWIRRVAVNRWRHDPEPGNAALTWHNGRTVVKSETTAAQPGRAQPPS